MTTRALPMVWGFCRQSSTTKPLRKTFWEPRWTPNCHCQAMKSFQTVLWVSVPIFPLLKLGRQPSRLPKPDLCSLFHHRHSVSTCPLLHHLSRCLSIPSSTRRCPLSLQLLPVRCFRLPPTPLQPSKPEQRPHSSRPRHQHRHAPDSLLLSPQ